MWQRKQCLLFVNLLVISVGLSFCYRAEADTIKQQLEIRVQDTEFQIDFQRQIQAHDQAMDIFEQQQRNKENLRDQTQRVKEQSQQTRSLIQDLRERIQRANFMAKLDQIKSKLFSGPKFKENLNARSREAQARANEVKQKMRDANMNIHKAQQQAQEANERSRMMIRQQQEALRSRR